MGIQSRRSERQKLSVQQELWCVLKDNLLLLYNAPTDTAPVQCEKKLIKLSLFIYLFIKQPIILSGITLELFVALSISLLKGRRAIVLRRSNRQVQVTPPPPPPSAAAGGSGGSVVASLDNSDTIADATEYTFAFYFLVFFFIM